MKTSHFFYLLFLFVIISCTKERDLRSATGKDNDRNMPAQVSSAESNSSGSGSGGSGGSGSSGGGGTQPTGLFLSVLSGSASRLVQEATDSIFVNFTQPAPPNGWTLSLTSSNPSAVQVASTFFVPPGIRNVQPRVTGGQITNATTSTITVRLNNESRTTTLKVFPLTAAFPAPQLQSPGNNSGFKPREIVTFTSNANNNAYYYQLQIANNSSFTNPETDLLLNDPLWRQSAFSGTALLWRMRFVAAGGGAGPWSAVRTFSIRP